MQSDKQQEKLGRSNAKLGLGGPGLPGKILTIVVGAALLVAALMVSLLMLAIVLAVGVVVGGYFWWKTRDLRKQMRARMDEQINERMHQPTHERPGERVVKGGEIEDVEFEDKTRH